MSDQFGIEEALQILGLTSDNKGVSTGSQWLESKGSKLESFSPADGKLIGSVGSANETNTTR